MPPKRKARPAPSEDQPPAAKRVTRSRGVLAETQPEANGTGRVTRHKAEAADSKPVARRGRGRPKSVVSTTEAEKAPNTTRLTRAASKQASAATLDASDEKLIEVLVSRETQRPQRKKGRPPGIPAKAIQPDRHSSLARDSPASSSKVTLEDILTHHVSDEEDACKTPLERRETPTKSTQQDDPDVEHEPDLLFLCRDTHTRFATPTRKTGVKAFTTPRHVVEVVVDTPSRRLRNAALPNTSASPSHGYTTITAPPKGIHQGGGSSTPSMNAQRAATPSPEINEFSESEDQEGSFDVPDMAVRASITPSALSQKVQAVVAGNLIPENIPLELHPCLEAQKRVALKSLRSMPVLSGEAEPEQVATNDVAFSQLCDLLKGTMDRGEGNSCFLTGPRGSGKTQLVEQAISTLSDRPIVIRLCGHVQTNDRLAVREMARQLTEQTGETLLPTESDVDAEHDEENPFLESNTDDAVFTLPSPAHLLALISTIPTLPRPTVIVIDAIDLFALHARQALLYCLFDTAQSCRAGKGTKGMAIVGVTTRVDTINTLEKRVKSRFSGRILRTACPGDLERWIHKARSALCTSIEALRKDWASMWEASVDAFLQDPVVNDVFKETFALTRDVRVLNRLLTPPIVALKPSSPFLAPNALQASAVAQRHPARFPFLLSLAYPSICLLIAAMHARASGHDTFTFEMLHESFHDQVRATQSAPVQVEGGGIGMVNCDREVLMGACEHLASLRIFVGVAPMTVRTGKGFVRYRCALDRAEVREVVAQNGQLNLRKWFSKS